MKYPTNWNPPHIVAWRLVFVPFAHLFLFLAAVFVSIASFSVERGRDFWDNAR